MICQKFINSYKFVNFTNFEKKPKKTQRQFIIFNLMYSPLIHVGCIHLYHIKSEINNICLNSVSQIYYAK